MVSEEAEAAKVAVLLDSERALAFLREETKVSDSMNKEVVPTDREEAVLNATIW